MSDEKLPILLTGPRPEDFRKNTGGGDIKELCKFTQEIRNTFINQLGNIKRITKQNQKNIQMSHV